MSNIEFTDRYGGNPPSWLRGCHADCEAMGVVPIFVAVREPAEGECVVNDEDNRAYLRLWHEAHAGPHEEPCDGWHFVGCPDCRGTGRVSWRATLSRIPRWLVKGARFIWQVQAYPGPRAASQSSAAFSG